MVLGDEVEQHGCLFLYTGIEFLASKGLIDLSYTALEGIVFLIAKKRRTTKLVAQAIDSLHRIIVCSVEGFLFCSLIDGEALIIVVVKRVEGIFVPHAF